MIVVGIAGGTCSGKSTLTERLFEALSENKDKKISVLHMDSYFKNPTPTTVAPITRIVYVEHNHPDSMRLEEMYKAFNELISGDSDIVIIEGLFAFHLDEIREKLDLKIFIDLKSDERIVRRIKRFMQGGQTMDEVTNRYLDTVRFRHDELIEPTRWHADIVVNGTLDANKATEIIKTYIESKI